MVRDPMLYQKMLTPSMSEWEDTPLTRGAARSIARPPSPPRAGSADSSATVRALRPPPERARAPPARSSARARAAARSRLAPRFTPRLPPRPRAGWVRRRWRPALRVSRGRDARRARGSAQCRGADWRVFRRRRGCAGSGTSPSRPCAAGELGPAYLGVSGTKVACVGVRVCARVRVRVWVPVRVRVRARARALGRVRARV